MLDFHEKRKIKGFAYSWPVIAGLFVFAILISFSVYERFAREREMAGKRDALASELSELELRAAALETEVARLKSDRGIEEEIRDRYEVAKQGEQVVVILGDTEDQSSSTTRALPSEGQEEPWYGFLWP